MPSTSESTTRPNKLSKMNDGATSKRTTRHSPDRQTAGPTNIERSTNANIADPHHLIGSRLEQISEDLASQPNSLQTTITGFQILMLDTCVVLWQYRFGSLCFNKPVIDSKTEKGLTDEDGEPKMCVHSSCGSKRPVEASSSFRDDPWMTAKIGAALKDHKARKVTISAHIKEVSWLETQLREEEIRGFFSSMLQLCHEHY